jgi:hypothetical protein
LGVWFTPHTSMLRGGGGQEKNRRSLQDYRRSLQDLISSARPTHTYITIQSFDSGSTVGLTYGTGSPVLCSKGRKKRKFALFSFVLGTHTFLLSFFLCALFFFALFFSLRSLFLCALSSLRSFYLCALFSLRYAQKKSRSPTFAS